MHAVVAGGGGAHVQLRTGAKAPAAQHTAAIGRGGTFAPDVLEPTAMHRSVQASSAVLAGSTQVPAGSAHARRLPEDFIKKSVTAREPLSACASAKTDAGRALRQGPTGATGGGRCRSRASSSRASTLGWWRPTRTSGGSASMPCRRSAPPAAGPRGVLGACACWQQRGAVLLRLRQHVPQLGAGSDRHSGLGHCYPPGHAMDAVSLLGLHGVLLADRGRLRAHQPAVRQRDARPARS